MPLLEQHWIGAGGEVLQAFGDDGVCQDGRRGRAIAGDIIRLGSGLFEELRAHIFKRVFQFDFLGDSHTIVRDGR